MTNYTTPEEYSNLRKRIGSQKDVAKLLGINIRTVQRRENGEILIMSEAVMALCYIGIQSFVRSTWNI
jgi:transcriptional regulator with XRE-family HTH domain